MAFSYWLEASSRSLHRLYRSLLLRSNQLCNYILYFVTISLAGFLALKSLKVKNPLDHEPRDIDLFFTSVSAATVSSMSTVEMEVFSNSQLIVLTILMLIGGEVFTSMLDLYLRKIKLGQMAAAKSESTLIHPAAAALHGDGQVELQSATAAPYIDSIESGIQLSRSHSTLSNDMKYNAVLSLAYTVAGFLLLVNIVGSLSVFLYISFVSSARDMLRGKKIQPTTFAVFTAVSTFANCGFLPTNENMVVFRKNSGLLLLIIPQAIVGNTLFPACLRGLIWFLKRTTRRAEFEYVLESSEKIGFYHLLPYRRCLLLAVTVLGFVLIQLVLVCAMEWRSEVFSAMNSYQKLMGALFLSVNSRHAGETIADLSALTPAISVLFVIMMYLPPYTSFLPFQDDKGRNAKNDDDVDVEEKKAKMMRNVMKSFVLSQLSYLAIFVILICITERKNMFQDPLNFSIFNIILEIVSAYGNVGFSMGYSCSRRLQPGGNCKDAWYGLAGKWSPVSKAILMFVMFFGRLKKFNMRGGQAWKLE